MSVSTLVSLLKLVFGSYVKLGQPFGKGAFGVMMLAKIMSMPSLICTLLAWQILSVVSPHCQVVSVGGQITTVI